MTRILLIGCVFLLCVWTGFYNSEKIKMRYKNLCLIKSALGILKTNISFFGYDICRAMAATDTKTQVEGLFEQASKNTPVLGAQKAWSTAVKECSKDLCLDEEDISTLVLLSARLGMTDEEGQIKNIDGVCAMLDTSIASAKYERDKYCKLYSGGGVLIGLFFCIMLV